MKTRPRLETWWFNFVGFMGTSGFDPLLDQLNIWLNWHFILSWKSEEGVSLKVDGSVSSGIYFLFVFPWYSATSIVQHYSGTKNDNHWAQGGAVKSKFAFSQFSWKWHGLLSKLFKQLNLSIHLHHSQSSKHVKICDFFLNFFSKYKFCKLIRHPWDNPPETYQSNDDTVICFEIRHF